MSNEVMDVSQAIDLDMHFIQRNVRDLAKTAQFSQMANLEELYQLAHTNLKGQLQPGKPLAEDPTLALETYKTLGGMALNFIEAKRRAADTLLKARTLFDEPPSDYADEEDGLPEDGLYETSSTETGLFGKIVADKSNKEEESEPDIAM